MYGIRLLRKKKEMRVGHLSNQSKKVLPRRPFLSIPLVRKWLCHGKTLTKKMKFFPVGPSYTPVQGVVSEGTEYFVMRSYLKQIIESRYPSLEDVWFVADGLKSTLQ